MSTDPAPFEPAVAPVSADQEPEGPVEPAASAQQPAAPGTRTGRTWIAFAFGMLALVLVLVFILQNLRSVRADFFTATWRIPLGVDLLLAAILGGLVVFLVGAARIVQLRRVARRHHDALVRAETELGHSA